MRCLLLILSFCVGALGFSLNLNNAGNAIAEAFRTRKLLESETTKIAHHFKLQQSPCGDAWLALATMLQNQTDPCNIGVLILQSSLHNATWTDGGLASHLNNFCDFSYMGSPTCLNKWQFAYENMTTHCSGFNTQTPLGGGWLANNTDFVARTVKTLVEALCQKDEEVRFEAPEVPDPLNISQNISEAEYDFTYRWVQFKNLIGINISTVNEAQLSWVCNDSVKILARWLIKNAPNQLAVGARQALSFCDTNPDVDGQVGFCALKVQALQMMNMDPDFAESMKKNPTPQSLAYLCDPCVKWGVRLALRIQNLLQEINSPGFQVSIRDELQKTVGALSVSCARHPNGKYCVELTAPLLSDTTAFANMFSPCISNLPTPCKASDPRDKCQLAVFELWRTLGCCLGSLQKALSLDLAGQAYIPIMQSILASCKLGAPDAVPPTCSQKINIITLPLKNVAHAFVMALDDDALKGVISEATGTDPERFFEVTCTKDGDYDNTTCVGKFYPDSTDSATKFPEEFNYNKQNGALFIPEFDIASLENSSENGGARLTTTEDAYDATSFSAATVDQCLNGVSPAKYTFDEETQTCVGICENNVKDGDESDVDCGGMGCARCPKDAQCVTELDCDPEIPDVVCKEVCSDKTGTCGLRCASFATALKANPLIILFGLLITMLLW